MEDFIAVVVVFLLMICGAVLFILIISWIVYWFTVNVSEINIVRVLVDKEEVYRGKSAFVSVTSGGYTTTVRIYKKLFPIEVIKIQYTSKDVVIEPAL